MPRSTSPDRAPDPARLALSRLVGGLLFTGLLALTSTIAAASDLEALSRGLAVLEDPRNAPRGELRLSSRIFVDEESMASIAAMTATVEAILDLTSVGLGSTSSEIDAGVSVSIVLAQIDGDPIVLADTVAIPVGEAAQWVYRREIELPEDFLEAAVVVRSPNGRWGATGCSFASGAPAAQPAVIVHQAPSLAPEPVPVSAPSATRSASQLRVLPPRKRPAIGRVPIDTLVASPEVERVVFFLNGRKIGADDKAPFSTVVELGDVPREHEIRAEAYAAGELLVGEDKLLINESNRPFEVDLQSVELESGVLRMIADVGTPTGIALDRVEFLVNDAVIATKVSPPFEATHPYADAGPNDFVSVRAWSADGEMREDARLLSNTGPSERVDVNLVEIYAVVTDASGRPIEDLVEADFTILHDGRDVTIERFSYADEVPLVLGLIIDTSGSMWPLMEETKRAGSKFLASTLIDGDRAFLVDFDTQPRLAHETTSRVGDLLRTFAGLTPDGFTAIYDALLFSLLQFEQVEDRRALVLLTDGDDVKSQYGRRRVIEYSRELGVPAYFIALGGVQDPRLANQRKLDLEGIARATGGRVHYISQLEELDAAYDQINAELRSQYVLTFSTDRALSDAEVEKIKLKVRRRGLEARIAIGRR